MLQDLYTVRGEHLSGKPWEVYPRPQMRRESYVNLNGKWEFAVSQPSGSDPVYDKKIIVPFCPESLLSGIHQHFPEGSLLHYRRKFTLPEGFHKGKVLLHIGAADQRISCFVNERQVGIHAGGYEAITFDITSALKEENTLEIRCTDDLRDLSMPYGKQTQNRGGMWYTPVSGIWQSVWLESVPEVYVEELDIQVNMTSATITVTPTQEGSVVFEGIEYPLVEGKAVIKPENPQLWSPEDPYLYKFTVETPTDRVDSYFALRTIESKTVGGIPRLCLNGKPYFFHGLLDQGYWPDGIYTPADPESYADDILAMKALGFNTLRKHIKVEPESFYYLCDKLGMVVFQDMVNNGDYSFFRDTLLPTVGLQKLQDKHFHKDRTTRENFLNAMEATVHQLKNHPCILYWTIFNEGWGQFDSDSAYEKLGKLDPSRIIDSTSGWFRRKKSDVESLHIYFNFWHRMKFTEKPMVISEFGGYTYAAEGHVFNPDKSYGYKTCTDPENFRTQLDSLYRQRILPAIPKGLCAAIYTQVSDVEDEINGLLTYDRKVCKADTDAMCRLAKDLQKAMGNNIYSSHCKIKMAVS